MELNICHLYPDLLNVYGDVGNVLVLKHRAELRGIKVNIINISLNEAFEKDNYDIVLFGGGQDFEQAIVSKDLISNKRDAIADYIEEGKVLIAICGGYQLLGNYYYTADGQKLDGLKILDLYTNAANFEAGDARFIGNTVIHNEEYNETYVGFENHSGRTYIGKDLKALGKCVVGFGNNGTDGYEGCVYKNTFGTYFHGTLLSKNPELADRFLTLALSKKYNEEIKLEPLDDTLELKAKEHIINSTKQN
ncbi:type 1 glutamine amidotransferase [uncultured Clostridium sp.]|uniref:type 1 glutamine amidotransferase n=1 Tax=uncultured Clostridium sp. TaxID=59620 RepID=UPI0026273888|nr:type 1 glutamine amidotransferase [uncultured Clostridium sp.]